MSNEPIPSAGLHLTSDTLREWTERRAELMAEADQLQQRIAAAALLLGVATPQPPPYTTSDIMPDVRSLRRVGTSGTMTDYIVKALATVRRGYTKVELRHLLQESHFADRIRKNPNSLYTLVKKAVERDELVEHAGLVFHASVFSTLTEAERLVGAVGEAGKPRDKVAAIILSNGGEATPAQIIKALSDDPEMQKRLEHSGYVYGLLVRMVEQGLLHRRDGAYRVGPASEHGDKGLFPSEGEAR